MDISSCTCILNKVETDHYTVTLKYVLINIFKLGYACIYLTRYK